MTGPYIALIISMQFVHCEPTMTSDYFHSRHLSQVDCFIISNNTTFTYFYLMWYKSSRICPLFILFVLWYAGKSFIRALSSVISTTILKNEQNSYLQNKKWNVTHLYEVKLWHLFFYTSTCFAWNINHNIYFNLPFKVNGLSIG